MTAKMKMMIQRTNVRFPRAPMVFPIMEMRRLSVGQDLANLNTLSWGGGDDGDGGGGVVVVVVRIFIVTIVLRLTPSWGVWFNLNSRPVRAGLE